MVCVLHRRRRLQRSHAAVETFSSIALKRLRAAPNVILKRCEDLIVRSVSAVVKGELKYSRIFQQGNSLRGSRVKWERDTRKRESRSSCERKQEHERKGGIFLEKRRFNHRRRALT